MFLTVSRREQIVFFFSSRRRHTRFDCDWSSDVCSSDLVTIADFAADLRAPTPSAAAELVVREKQAIVDGLDTLRRRLDRAVRRPLTDLERRVDDVRSRLDHAGGVDHHPVAQRDALLIARLESA